MIRINHYRTIVGTDRTLGEWWLGGIKLCDTLELPWLDNAADVSCIPEGEYELVKGTHASYKGPLGKLLKYDCYTVANVPNRTDIDVHIGNFPKDTKGCILVGVHDPVKGAVLQDSKATFNGLMERLNTITEPIQLKVEYRYEPVVPEAPKPVMVGELPSDTKPLPKIKVGWIAKLWALFNLNKRNLALALGAASTVIMKSSPEIGGALLAISTILGTVGITHDVKKRADNPSEEDWLAKLFNILEQLLRTLMAKRKK
jgi:hypothetical protein